MGHTHPSPQDVTWKLHKSKNMSIGYSFYAAVNHVGKNFAKTTTLVTNDKDIPLQKS
jgi:hypothetical protein